jgi:mono/diheme cytochrome c family protein
MSPRLALAALLLAACDWSLHRMNEQPRCEALDETPWLPNRMCNQHPPPGTVPFAPGGPAAADAPPPTRALLERGRERFAIFCATCHGRLGDGASRVAAFMRLRPPPSLHLPRLRAAPDAHLAAVIERGFGLMPGYGAVLPPADRWAVTYYVRALQLSQDAALDALPPAIRDEVRPWLR